MFAEEQPALGPLPLKPFRYYRFGVRTVQLDGVHGGRAAYYGTPPGCIGRRVDVQWNDLFVRRLGPHTGQLLREHVGAPRGWHRIADADRPPSTPPKPVALLAAAMRIGAAVSTICDHVHRHEGEAGVRRILGVLSLAKKHGPALIEDAAKAALDLGSRRIASFAAIPNAGHPCRSHSDSVDPLIQPSASHRVEDGAVITLGTHGNGPA